MEMIILPALCLGILGVVLLISGITSAFKKIPSARAAIAWGIMFIVTALVIIKLVKPLL